FGEETAHPEIECKSYWRDDDLHQRIRNGGTALVSGCGDGGLVDTIRVLLRDYRHEWLAKIAAAAAADDALVAKLMSIEHDAPSFPDGKVLTEATAAVAVPATVTAMLGERLRPRTTVMLNGRADGPLTRGACILNRFIVAQLMKLG